MQVLSSDVHENAVKQLKALDPKLVISTYACSLPAVRVMGMNETAIRILVVLVAFGVILCLGSA